MVTLSWDELARDLRLARRHTDDIWIYSLEGCAAQGMLGRLEALDWRIQESVRTLAVRGVDSVRVLLWGILLVASHPYASTGVISLALVLRRWKRATKARRDS
jgi:hypothetical protein